MTDSSKPGIPATEAGRGAVALMPGALTKEGMRRLVLAIEAEMSDSALLRELNIEALAYGIFMSMQPRSRQQWEEAPEASRDHYRRQADAALYHAGLLNPSSGDQSND